MSVVEYKTETGSERGAIWEEKMAIWLIRAGSHGEYEQKFIQEGRVYVTWDELNLDLSKLHQRGELSAEMTQRYPKAKPKAVLNWVGQV
ncbi:MAG: hypothetical protein ACK4WE_07425 [Burkholderiales bacterium]|jgi:restriction system protein